MKLLELFLLAQRLLIQHSQTFILFHILDTYFGLVYILRDITFDETHNKTDFKQIYDINYEDTFSLVVKATTIKITISFYAKLDKKLYALGFDGTKINTPLFYYHKNDISMFILLYVDDTIIASTSMLHAPTIVHWATVSEY
ncbi:hypothetical protein ACJX0J_010297 [Zea mays]